MNNLEFFDKLALVMPINISYLHDLIGVVIKTLSLLLIHYFILPD